jgi:putative peptidoglycan lipid II flippase
VIGSGVEGAVVAYQVGWVFFLAPYGILAQPIHTAILPELVGEAGQPEQFAASVRWATERIALLVLPVSAGMIALARPGMGLVSFGATGEAGAELLAAALGSLAVGLLPYSAFLLLARAGYALGDSRTPGVVALVSAAAGVAVMAAGLAVEGSARVLVLGLGHSAAYLVGAIVLGNVVERTVGFTIRPAHALRLLAPSLAATGVAWGVQRAVTEVLEGSADRVVDLAAVLAGGAAGLAVVLAGYRLLHLPARLTRRLPAAMPLEPEQAV